MATESKMDAEFMKIGREHITQFLRRTGESLKDNSGHLLEIGPQDHLGASHFLPNFEIATLDVVDTFNPTIVGDITQKNEAINDDRFDCVMCMEVLEHCLNPFAAIQEIRRVLKHGGYLLVSAPLNVRIHGPIPDCWRFTEHGFKILLKDFDIIELDILETPGRDLFPVHYNLLAKNNKLKNTPVRELKFRFID